MSEFAKLLGALVVCAITSECVAREPTAAASEHAETETLPADGGPEFNRLVFEKSPYLLQHARNPVDWYPWGTEAFERALREQKPIFLSIGYSTCHWCHVMEHESFEDTEVAELLNKDFVCIKVDREERPDVDELYMSFTQAATGGGGWPMTVFLTPEREPYFAATYLPKSATSGQPGMLELVPALARAWREDRENVVAAANRAAEWLRKQPESRCTGELDAGVLELTERALEESYDERWGGFGDAPKFPIAHNLRFLLRRHLRTGEPRPLDMAIGTLRAMRAGGLWDHIGFGFHRYSTDREWLVPHFEKMLYDQALLALAYVEAWQVTGADDLRQTAEDVFTYVLRDMTSPDGAFYSAQDADSGGIEGSFYTWTPKELVDALGDEDGAAAAELWNVRDSGNVDGRSVLHTTAVELDSRASSMRERLFAARERRTHPRKDDKILTDWNGLMIAALAYGGRSMDAPRYVEAAARAADFVLARMRTSEGRLLKSYRDGEARGAGVHDDYAFFAWGLIELYESTGELRWLASALEIVELERQLFLDEQNGGFYLAARDATGLIARPKTASDGALPSGNSIAALNLARLSRFTGRPELEERARRTLRAFGDEVRRGPAGYSQLLIALDFTLGPTFEIVVAGRRGSVELGRALRALRRPFAPNKVLLVHYEGESAALGELAPFAASQRVRDDRVTLYLCRDFACELPTHDLDRVLGALRGDQEH